MAQCNDTHFYCLPFLGRICMMCYTNTHIRTHTHAYTHISRILSCWWLAFFLHMPPQIEYIYRYSSNERTNETNEEWQQEGNAFEDFRHFSRTLPFHSFSFAFVFVCSVFFDLRLFYTFFLRSRALLKSQKRRRRENELDRLHCINERKYAHLDERREYLNDSGFLPPLPMRNEALQMNYHHFYVTQYVCVRVSVCMSSEDQNASFESWKLRTEREREKGGKESLSISSIILILYLFASYRFAFIHFLFIHSFCFV